MSGTNETDLQLEDNACTSVVTNKLILQLCFFDVVMCHQFVLHDVAHSESSEMDKDSR